MNAERAIAADLGEASLPRPGDVVAGKYRILRVLGTGGMGVVVEAEHADLRQRVALKFLRPLVADNEVPVARLLREARAACAIRSEHVARVLDVGTLPGGAPFVVMEYLTGTDLRGILGRKGPLPVEDAVDYVLQACEALAEAHSLGIVHRDIKPSNLFLTSRADGSPLIKVLDFGIAKLLRASAAESLEDVETLTGHGLVVGSPRYTPPERLKDPSNVGPCTDIWALGVVLHELLTGKSPFEARTISSLYYRIAADPPTRVRDVRRDVPEGLEEAILHCLRKNPKQRTQDVAELAAALRPFAPERSETSVRRVIRVIGAVPSERSAAITTRPEIEKEAGPRGALSTAVLARSRRRGPELRAALGFFGAALLLAGALVSTGVRSSSSNGRGERLHARSARREPAAPTAKEDPQRAEPPAPAEPTASSADPKELSGPAATVASEVRSSPAGRGPKGADAWPEAPSVHLNLGPAEPKTQGGERPTTSKSPRKGGTFLDDPLGSRK